MKKIVGYKRLDNFKYEPIIEEMPDVMPQFVTREEILKKIKDETCLFFGSTNGYMGMGFDELSTKAFEKGAMMVYNILFPT